MYHRIMRFLFKIISVDDSNYLPSKVFDVSIIILIAGNVVLLILDTFSGFSESTRQAFQTIELISVIIFSVEYLLRVWTAPCLYPTHRPGKARLHYATSFMAMIDLLAILPFYIPLLIPIDLRVLRMVRLLRLLRILKVNRYTSALSTIGIISAGFIELIESEKDQKSGQKQYCSYCGEKID